jgi:hypothetical protein
VEGIQMDFLETFNALDEIFSGVHWCIEKYVLHPVLNGFNSQVTGNKLLPVEYIKQQGDPDYGYSGEAYIPLHYENGSLYLYITFSD